MQAAETASASSAEEPLAQLCRRQRAPGEPLSLADILCHDNAASSDASQIPIWSRTRQELCECLEYFKSYQGGHYAKAGRNYGYLLDKHSAPRDVFSDSGRVFISHGGGSSKPASSMPTSAASTVNGGYVLTKSQTLRDHRIAAIVNNIADRKPTLVLAGQGFAPLSAVLRSAGVRYAVLGYYVATHIWSEPSSSNLSEPVRVKIRFEWVESQGSPWWLRAPFCTLCRFFQSNLPPEPRLGVSTIQCAKCEKTSPSVYNKPICLNADCEIFARVDVADFWADGSTTATYSANFLRSQRLIEDIDLPRIVPASISELRTAAAAFWQDERGLEKSSWKGVWCDVCGKLCLRVSWGFVSCDRCGNSCNLNQKRYAVADLVSSKPRPLPKMATDVRTQRIELMPWVVDIYQLPDVEGKIYHMASLHHDATLSRFFDAFQAPDTARLFKRRELRSHKNNAFLSSSYSFNVGAAYRFALKTDTIALEVAPQIARDVLGHLQSATHMVVGDFAAFNELLPLAYRDDAGLSFHADDEAGVGGVIASLSLGAPAKMDFRKKVPKRAKAGDEQPKERRNVSLSIQLRHGDILIMSGSAIQQRYEHAVSSTGDLRFGITARRIT